MADAGAEMGSVPIAMHPEAATCTNYRLMVSETKNNI